MTAQEKKKYRKTKKWKSFRQKLIQKNDHQCQMCYITKRGKKTKFLQVHHLNPDKYGRENEDDVVLLCSTCHKRIIEIFLKRINFDIEDFIVNMRNIYNKSKEK